jgi:hypothetical protein
VNSPLILSNLFDIAKSSKRFPLSKQEEYKIYKVKVKKHNDLEHRSAYIKIGVIGLLTN